MRPQKKTDRNHRRLVVVCWDISCIMRHLDIYFQHARKIAGPGSQAINYYSIGSVVAHALGITGALRSSIPLARRFQSKLNIQGRRTLYIFHFLYIFLGWRYFFAKEANRLKKNEHSWFEPQKQLSVIICLLFTCRTSMIVLVRVPVINSSPKIDCF